MTAVNAFLSPTAVHLVTDGSVYLPDGHTVGSMQKVVILAHLPCVIASRGSAEFPRQILAHSLAYDSFDKLAARFGAFCKGVTTEMQAMAQAYGEAVAFERSEFVAAGWSETRQRLETYVVCSHVPEGAQPWQAHLLDPEANLMAPDLGDAEADQLERSVGGDFSAAPLRGALALMEAQRQLRVEGFKDPPVGRFVQLTTITRERITTEILKRWPDQVAA